MAKRQIVVAFTREQAMALLWALGNSTTAPDVMESILPSASSREACYRAQAAIEAALRGNEKKDMASALEELRNNPAVQTALRGEGEK